MEGSGEIERRKRTQKDYSLAFKLQVVTEIEEGYLTYKQAQRKYGIQGRSTVLIWLRKHGTLGWRKQEASMGKAKGPSPREEIRRLKRELERAREDKQVLQIAIDIAEQELGIDIRKKYLAKLSRQVGNKGQSLVSGESEDCLASAGKVITNEARQKDEKQKKPNG